MTSEKFMLIGLWQSSWNKLHAEFIDCDRLVNLPSNVACAWLELELGYCRVKVESIPYDGENMVKIRGNCRGKGQPSDGCWI